MGNNGCEFFQRNWSKPAQDTWAAQSTPEVQEGNILDIISVTLSTNNDKNISQSSFEKTGRGGGLHQSIDCAKHSSWIFLITMNQVGKIGSSWV